MPPATARRGDGGCSGTGGRACARRRRGRVPSHRWRLIRFGAAFAGSRPPERPTRPSTRGAQLGHSVTTREPGGSTFAGSTGADQPLRSPRADPTTLESERPSPLELAVKSPSRRSPLEGDHRCNRVSGHRMPEVPGALDVVRRGVKRPCSASPRTIQVQRSSFWRRVRPGHIERLQSKRAQPHARPCMTGAWGRFSRSRMPATDAQSLKPGFAAFADGAANPQIQSANSISTQSSWTASEMRCARSHRRSEH